MLLENLTYLEIQRTFKWNLDLKGAQALSLKSTLYVPFELVLDTRQNLKFQKSLRSDKVYTSFSKPGKEVKANQEHLASFDGGDVCIFDVVMVGENGAKYAKNLRRKFFFRYNFI